MDQRDDKRPSEDTAQRDAETDADFRALAEDWIAIWQSEITAYLTDPETQTHWSAMAALWGEAAQAMIRVMPQASGVSPRHDRSSAASPTPQPARPDAAARPAPTADASEPRDDEVRRLEQRVAELERRLATDASRADAGRGDAKRKPAGGDRGPRRGSRARG